MDATAIFNLRKSTGKGVGKLSKLVPAASMTGPAGRHIAFAQTAGSRVLLVAVP